MDTNPPNPSSNSTLLEFNFAIGPAQSFIGAARTTNDFWAGSFVLSWLSGVAMVTARKLGAKLVYPAGVDDVLDALEQGKPDALDRQAAALPAKFCAEVDAGFDARLVAAAVKTAWRALATHVYAKDMRHMPGFVGGADALGRTLWDQQMDEAFDIQWTVHEFVHQFARRKYWHTQNRTPQVGMKCMLMPQFQELSMASNDAERKAFWAKLSKLSQGDVKAEERLCAPALVKRRVRRSLGSLPATAIAKGTAAAWTLRGITANHKVPDTCELSGMHHFYAMVRMDIDGLGAADNSSYAAVSAFAQQVNTVVAKVTEQRGYTLYAGGDDVLAFVPVAAALACAAALRRCLDTVQKDATHLTASAAVLICHEKSPLADALHRSQALLANIAKEATGRDALAVQLCKPGGDVQTYSAPWALAWDVQAPEQKDLPQLKLTQFAALIGKSDGFSSGYIYWLRSYFNQINMARKSGGGVIADWTDNMLQMMVTQYLHQQRGGDGDATSYEEALAQLTPLLAICMNKVRVVDGGLVQYKLASAVDSKRSNFSIEPALVGRFLAEVARKEQEDKAKKAAHEPT